MFFEPFPYCLCSIYYRSPVECHPAAELWRLQSRDSLCLGQPPGTGFILLRPVWVGYKQNIATGTKDLKELKVLTKISAKVQPQYLDKNSASKSCLNFSPKFLIETQLQNLDQSSTTIGIYQYYRKDHLLALSNH